MLRHATPPAFHPRYHSPSQHRHPVCDSHYSPSFAGHVIGCRYHGVTNALVQATNPRSHRRPFKVQIQWGLRLGLHTKPPHTYSRTVTGRLRHTPFQQATTSQPTHTRTYQLTFNRGLWSRCPFLISSGRQPDSRTISLFLRHPLRVARLRRSFASRLQSQVVRYFRRILRTLEFLLHRPPRIHPTTCLNSLRRPNFCSISTPTTSS